MDQAALRAALGQATSTAPAPKAQARPRPAAAGNDTEVLNTLIRDHLYLRQDFRPVADSVQIAVLFKSDTEVESFHGLAQKWAAKIPEGSKKGKGKNDRKKRKADEGEEAMKTDDGTEASSNKHPFGPKKVFMLFALFSRLMEIATNAKETIQASTDLKREGGKALETLSKLGGEELDNFFTGFVAK
eukprot:3901919-Pyramimonas_sp.AAC.1